MGLNESCPPEDEEQGEERDGDRDPPRQRLRQSVGIAAVLDEVVERRAHRGHDAEKDGDHENLREHTEAPAAMPGSIVDGSAGTSAAPERKRRFRPTLWPTLATLIVFPVLLGLGWWQLERADFKQAQEARVAAEDARAPAVLGTGSRSRRPHNPKPGTIAG